MQLDNLEPFGNKDCDIMFISSLPSDWNKRRGDFYPDTSMTRFCNRAEVHPSEIYFTCAFKDGTKPKKWKPKKADYDEWKPVLDKEIAKVRPQFVVLFGAEAVKMVVNDKIMNRLGSSFELDGTVYVVSYNPSIVYFDATKQVFIEQASDNFAMALQGKLSKLPKLNVRVVTSKKEVRQAIRHLKKYYAYDIETTGLSRFHDKIMAFGFGNTKVQYIIPLGVKYSPIKNKPKLQWHLVRYAITLLNDLGIGGIAGNGKFDNLFCQQTYGKKPNQIFDVVLASHIINENTPNGVKDTAMLEFNVPNWEIDLDLKKGIIKSYQGYLDYLHYLGYDIYFTYKLFLRQRRQIGYEGLSDLYNHLYLPAIRAFEKVETNGAYIRQSRFNKVDKVLTKRIKKAGNKLTKLKDINWNSNDEVATYLFEDEGLPVIEETAEGKPSVKEDVLKQLMDKHKAPAMILAYRKMVKQKSTYIHAWQKELVEGRLYPNFGMLLVTGRTSCSKPNLQQVPNDPFIRSLIGARKGRVFVEIDFSQAELRVATIFSNDREMTRIYKEGGDIHSTTYEIITGEKVSSDPKVRKKQRKIAKSVNFGEVATCIKNVKTVVKL